MRMGASLYATEDIMRMGASLYATLRASQGWAHHCMPP